MQAIILLKEESLFRLCGLPLWKRNLYLLRSKGIRDVSILVEGKALSLPEAEREKAGEMGIRLKSIKPASLSSVVKGAGDDLFVIIDGDCVFDPAFLESLLRSKRTTLSCDSHPEKRCVEGSAKVLSRNGRVQKIGDSLGKWNMIYAGMALCDKRTLLEMENELTSCANWPNCLNKVLENRKVNYLDVSLSVSYSSELRRNVKPFWYRISSSRDLKIAKRYFVEGTQKKTLDILAWHIHRPIENKIVYYLSELPVTPNQLTIFTNVFAFFITFLFLRGQLLIASFLTLLVNILDGLDGKQARAKGMTTRVGQLEHSLDTLYEQSWYIAFSWAVFTITGSLLPLGLCLVMLLSDTFSRHCSMQFRMVMKTPLADYAEFDRAFRRFDGRRNIYTLYILTGVLLGLPLYSLFAMTTHAILTATVYFVRSVKHMHSADVGE